MGIFGRLQKGISEQERRGEGLTPADLLELPTGLRRLMTHVIRRMETTAEVAAEALGEPLPEVRDRLADLAGKGFVERVERDGVWYYAPRFASKQGRDIPPGIWSALEDRAKE